MLSFILFSWIIKQIIKVEPEQGQSDGSGFSQIPRLRLQLRNPVKIYKKIIFKKEIPVYRVDLLAAFFMFEIFLQANGWTFKLYAFLC